MPQDRHRTTVYALYTVSAHALCFESPRKNSREESVDLRRAFAKNALVFRFVLRFVTSARTFIEIQAPCRDAEKRTVKVHDDDAVKDSRGNSVPPRKSDCATAQTKAADFVRVTCRLRHRENLSSHLLRRIGEFRVGEKERKAESTRFAV